VDVAVSVFAPVGPDEFARVVRPGGHALVVIPGARHLAALRELLYEEAQPHDEALPPLAATTFDLVVQERVEGEITLADSATQRDLLTMTPYRFAVPPEAIARAAAAEPVTTPIAFVLALLRRRA
jgi:23S rRNA (guanine745-N1)-methyltransferase